MRLEILLRPEMLAVEKFDHALEDRITKGISESNGHIKLLLAAVLDTYQMLRDDKRILQQKFASMTVGTKRGNKGNFSLTFENVPSGVTYDGEHITRSQENRANEVVRDSILTPPLPPNPTPEQVSECVYLMVHRSRILQSDPRVRAFSWGGHSKADRKEEEFERQLGYFDGIRGMEIITGSGGGSMKAPFEGALRGYIMQNLRDRRFIGFTEQGILAGEAPNNLLSDLLVFPNIEMRMEAFIRASHRGRVHPGGTGTMEEAMTFLGMKIHPKNDGLLYPFDLIESPEGNYMRTLQNFFRECFGNALDGLMEFHIETPAEYHQHVLKTNKDLQIDRLWNHELHIPPEIQTPFEVTFDSMEALDLTRDQEPFLLIVNLRRFFSGMVYLIVKNPQMVESWSGDRPKIRGDKKIIEAVDRLVRWFNREKRLKIKHEFKDLPYRIE